MGATNSIGEDKGADQTSMLVACEETSIGEVFEVMDPLSSFQMMSLEAS